MLSPNPSIMVDLAYYCAFSDIDKFGGERGKKPFAIFTRIFHKNNMQPMEAMAHMITRDPAQERSPDKRNMSWDNQIFK